MGNKEDQAQRLLNGAYALKNSNDNTRYYREFAPIYDEQFADALGYSYPQTIADVFVSEHAAGEDVPVLDIGCGTGLVAQYLVGSGEIDGVDLSAEMLGVARHKCVYRDLYCLDLTEGLGEMPRNYGGVVSAGTFTHGHLGPGVLENLLAVGRDGALYVIGINAEHFHNAGFEGAFSLLLRAEKITEYRKCTADIYRGSTARPDQAIIAIFRKSVALR